MISFMYEYANSETNEFYAISVINKETGQFIGRIFKGNLTDSEWLFMPQQYFIYSPQDLIQITGKVLNPYDKICVEDQVERTLREQRQLDR